MMRFRHRIKVDAYSGYKANERPVSFTIKGKTVKVRKIISRWYEENHEHFRLKADSGSVYVICYDRKKDEWELIEDEGS